MRKLTLLLIFIATAITGCKKFTDIPPSSSLLESRLVFNDEGSVLNALYGVYGQLRAGSPSFLNGDMSIFMGLYSGEIKNQNVNANYDTFYNNTLVSTNSKISSSMWDAPYKTIYSINLILEGLEKYNLTESFKKQIKGELLLIRSLYFFYLNELYNGVPYTTSSNFEINSKLARLDRTTLLQNIQLDLEKSAQYLGESYPVAGKVRPNRYAALALLARIYLFTEQWEKAEVTSSMVLEADYSLESVTSAFKPGNSESLWEIATPSNIRNTIEGTTFVPANTTSQPQFVISKSTLDLFSLDDKRLSNWIGIQQISGVSYYYPYKYRDRNVQPVTENLIVLRLAEQYLIRSEARLKQNKITSSIEDLNKLRTRAGIALMTVTNNLSIEDQIVEERQREFFAEWGHRWFDLRRLNNADEVKSKSSGSWQSYKQNLPIPYSQIRLNVFLTQNEGYE